MNELNVVKEALLEITQLIEQGQLRSAKLLCTSSLQKHPEDKDLLVKHALIDQLLGNMEAAQKTFATIDPKYLETLFFVHQSMDFYLRNQKYTQAKSLLERANKANYKKPRLRKRVQKMNMIFNVQTETKEDNVVIAQQYIQEYPEDSFGYLYYMQSIAHCKPDNLPEILDSLHSKIQQNNLPLNVVKSLFRTQHKLYSLLKINDYEIAEQKTRKLLIERLQILLNLNQDVAEINQIILELFATPLTKSEFSSLLREARKYKPLEFQIIQHIERYPHWLEYEPIRQQLEIIKHNRQLQTIPLPNQVREFPHPVDVVFTWCDIQDPILLEKFIAQNDFNPLESDSESNGKCRYTNNQEIVLALISLFKYFSNVNHIYIVTNEQKFELDFLSIEQKQKISFVFHSEIIPAEYITRDIFNSNLIETFLWNIPNLKEHFLYFNDDVILGDFIRPHHLFDRDGIAVALTTPRKHNANLKLDKLIDFHQGEVVPWNISRVNAIKEFEVLNQELQPFVNVHQGMFFVRSECAKAFQKYKHFWLDSFFQEMIRGRNSVFSLLIFVWEAVRNGKQKIGEYYYYNRLSAVFNAGLNLENVQYIKEVKPLFYCLNNLPDEVSISSLHELVNYVLGVNHASGVQQLVQYISEKAAVENIIQVGLGAFNCANINVNHTTINLQECFGLESNVDRKINPEVVDRDLLAQKLAIDGSVLEKSIVVVSDIVEEIEHSTVLLETLSEWSQQCKYLVASAPAKEKVLDPTRVVESNDFQQWTLDRLSSFLAQRGFQLGLNGYTVGDRFHDCKTELVMISGVDAVPKNAEKVPVTAIINCYNESDIISNVILHLIEQDVKIFVVDNWSTDGSFEIVTRLANKHPNVQVARFPETATNNYNWNEQLINTTDIAKQLGHGWYLHYDADEIRESPWQGVNLREAISFVDSLGYNAIDFTIVAFRYLKNDSDYDYKPALERLRYWCFGDHQQDFEQIKGWKYYGQEVDLNASGGHFANFEGRKVYPLKFLTRHYPLRSHHQASKKLFCDRFPRFRSERQKFGWHNHYDHITEKQLEGWNKKSLLPWNRITFNTEYLIERISGIGISPAESLAGSSIAYQEAIQLQPNNARLYFMLAKAQHDEGAIEEAIVSTKKALHLDASNVDIIEQLSKLLQLTNKVGEAIALIQQALTHHDNPRLHIMLGDLQRYQRDFPAAISAYQASIASVPENVVPHISLNQLLIQDNRIEETIASCRHALDWHPQELQLHFILGKAYAKQKEWELAISSHQKALELDNNSSAIIHVHLGNAFYQLGNHPDALASYQNAVNSQPHSYHGYIGLGNYYRQHQEWSKAIYNYQQAIKLNCRNSGVYFALGQSQQKEGDIDRAIAAYKYSIELQPNNFDSYLALGNCYYHRQNLELAAVNYQQAIKINPDHANVCFALGQVLREQGKSELAILHYQQALSLNHPDLFKIYSILGDTLSEIDQIQQATRAYEQAMQIQPDNPVVQSSLQKLVSSFYKD